MALPQFSTSLANVWILADVIGDIRSKPGLQVACDEVDESWNLLARVQHVRSTEARGLNVEIHNKHAKAALGQRDCCIRKSQRTADTTLKGVKRLNLHANHENPRKLKGWALCCHAAPISKNLNGDMPSS